MITMLIHVFGISGVLYHGGTMLHKIILFLVYYIVQNGHIDPKSQRLPHISKYFWQILMTYYLVIKKPNNFCINQKVYFGADLGGIFPI